MAPKFYLGLDVSASDGAEQSVGVADVDASTAQVVPDGGLDDARGPDEVNGEGVHRLAPRALRPRRHIAVDKVRQAAQRPRRVRGDEARVGSQLRHERPRKAAQVLLQFTTANSINRPSHLVIQGIIVLLPEAGSRGTSLTKNVYSD